MESEPGTTHYEVLIVGAGAAGISVAARLLQEEHAPQVALLDPATRHYYQPLWTLVGAGVVPKEASMREQEDLIPLGATWIQDAATAIDPEAQVVRTAQGQTLTYDYLIVCPGLKIRWDGIEGLKESLGSNGVCSNYGYEQSEYTWETTQRLASIKRPVRAIFTTPATPIKCGGAPQKVMYMTADYLRKNGRLDRADIHFFSPGTVIFGVPEFARTLKKVVARYGIQTHFGYELVEIRGDEHEAVFRTTGGNGQSAERVERFDMLHVTPPQGPPDVIKNSALADEAGWVAVDRDTLQHVRYLNVFALGDAGGTPNARSGAAIRKQAPVVVHNLMQVRRQGNLTHPLTYDGYSSCPLVTGYGKMMLAEFDYDNRPAPSFPFDTTQERYSMYVLKKDILPNLYWHGMLRGRA